MKVLTINTHDIRGGAAKAAYRLHQALIQSGLSSTMIVGQKFSLDPSIISVEDPYHGRSAFFDALPHYSYKKESHVFFSSAMVRNMPLLTFINNSDADIVHIHWVSQGFLSLEDIAEINKPIIFSLHDMWLFTGGCHYTQGCEAYLTYCQYCPALQSTQSEDLSSVNFKRKIQLFHLRNDITIVGLSRWIATEAKRSVILYKNRVEQLPNPINTDIFRPTPQHKARFNLNLPANEPIIIFAADGGTNDPRKGYKYLNNILSYPLSNQHFHIITFGNSTTEKIEQSSHTIHHLTAIEDENEIAMLLSAANIVVLPSVQENLSNLVLESLSCGTPVVAFDIGGNSDMIRHLENGYLATFADSQDLVKGINWALSQQFEPEKIWQQVLDHFGYGTVAAKYIELYQSLQSEAQELNSYSMPNLLQVGDSGGFEWTTADLREWIAALNLLKRPCIIYGFGILGRYLHSRLAPYCTAVIDKNFLSYRIQYPTIEFGDLERLNGLSNALVLVSIYDPENTIRFAIESRVGSSCKVLSLLEPFSMQDN